MEKKPTGLSNSMNKVLEKQIFQLRNLVNFVHQSCLSNFINQVFRFEKTEPDLLFIRPTVSLINQAYFRYCPKRMA